MNITAAGANTDLGRNKDHFYFQRDSRGHNLNGRFLSNLDFGDPPHAYESLSDEHSNSGMYVVIGILMVALLVVVF